MKWVVAPIGAAYLAVAAALGACAMSTERPVHPGGDSVSAANSASDSRYRTLPFDTTFTKRWNAANDGTDYEPCTALSREVLMSVGVDPDSVLDAAGTDGQTARGCKWQYADPGRRDRWVVIQIVGNSPGLAVEKRSVSSSADRWLPDIGIAGRVVGVHYREFGSMCETYVQSGSAAVSTIVTTHDELAESNEICDRAIAFTRATIDKIPH